MNRSPSIRRLRTSENGFDGQLRRLLDREDDIAGDVYAVVKAIVDDVRKNGDTALVRYTNEFDGRQVSRARELVLDDLSAYRDRIASELLQALEQAAARIRAYHECQKQESWRIEQDDGTVLGQQVRPLDRVGVYVPGGKAAYPSSVLMNVIPAKVAGVDDVVMVVPAPNGRVEPVVLAAAAVADVDRVISIGGAQAIAALAFGTETVPAVDKIVGPGNIYVATAKSMVFGKVGIDMIAGPSEILIVCDGGTDPDWVAMDLFSQAEHDEDAQAILLSPDAAFLEAVAASIERLLPTMERRAIIEASLTERGALIEVESIDEALELVNHIAPEHLELSVANADELVSRVRHAGAIFVGRHTAEAVGDYCAGPNHVLPTAGTARFSSPLGVYDFQKRSSIIQCTVEGSMTLGKIAATLARGEGLTAHARAAEMRAEDGG